jgi:hypothetical protein
LVDQVDLFLLLSLVCSEFLELCELVLKGDLLRCRIVIGEGYVSRYDTDDQCHNPESIFSIDLVDSSIFHRW